MLLVSPADKNETEEDDTDDSTISARGDFCTSVPSTSPILSNQ